jgi:hypothetical protein
LGRAQLGADLGRISSVDGRCGEGAGLHMQLAAVALFAITVLALICFVVI